MDASSGRVYESAEAAKEAGVREPLIVQGQELIVDRSDAAAFLLVANGQTYRNNRSGRRRALKDQRRVLRVDPYALSRVKR